jgi:hypothetical protein
MARLIFDTAKAQQAHKRLASLPSRAHRPLQIQASKIARSYGDAEDVVRTYVMQAGCDVTVADVVEDTGVPKSTAGRMLNKLVQDGVLIASRRLEQSRWIATYRSRTWAE